MKDNPLKTLNEYSRFVAAWSEQFSPELKEKFYAHNLLHF